VAETTAPPWAIPGIERLERIGRGGFGTVYRGWQPDLRREVAVKVLDAPASDEASAARFRREGMAMGALSDHPNVVPLYATGTVDDRLYLVMPYLPEGSLADQLRSGPLAAGDVARLGRDLADALCAAHAAGVLHRDVKPANVLRSAYGSLQLADFGVARFADGTQTMTGSVLATVAYAAPEVLGGEPATEASDVYSLGATLHAALRGRPPYETGPHDAAVSLAVRVLSSEPPDLRSVGVPASMADVVEQAMARDPADRYPSAAALRDALDELDLSPTDAAVVAVVASAGDDGAATVAVPPPSATEVAGPTGPVDDWVVPADLRWADAAADEAPGDPTASGPLDEPLDAPDAPEPEAATAAMPLDATDDAPRDATAALPVGEPAATDDAPGDPTAAMPLDGPGATGEATAVDAGPAATAVAPVPAGSLDPTAVSPTVHDHGPVGPSTERRTPPAAPSAAPADPERDRRGAWLLGALAALVVLVAALAWTGSDDGGDGGPLADAAPDTTVGQTEPEVTEPAVTEVPPVDEVEADEGPEDPVAEAPGPPDRKAAATADVAVRDYYALMDAGRIDDGWARLSPAYQERTGEASYRSFWSTIDAVEVQNVRADGLEATATLRYTRTDGSRSTERVVLRFVQGPDGSLLIDDYRPA
jgi:hypothetical protein